MVLALVSAVLFFLVGVAFVFGTYLLPKGLGLASWRRQGPLIIGCALLTVSMLPLGLQVGRMIAEQHCDDSPRAPMAGDPSFPTADPITPGEYIVFATVAMDADAASEHPCFAVIAPVYGNDVDADAMRIHMLPADGPCRVTNIFGARWRLRAVPVEDGSTQFIAVIPSYGDACASEDDAMPDVPDVRVTPGSSSL